MPVPSENFAPLLFLLELEVQSAIAKDAYANIEAGCPGWLKEAPIPRKNRSSPIQLISRSIVFLSTAAVISKTLFSTVKGPPTKRATRLRELTGIEKGMVPNLSSREARNGVEHVDERLDEYFADSKFGSAPYGMEVSEVPPKATDFVARHLNPRTLVFSAAGAPIDMRACYAELPVIDAGIKLGFSKLKQDPFPLWDPPKP